MNSTKIFISLLLSLYISAITTLSAHKTSYVKGDISHQNVDVIVNAANEQLADGSGVCGAIFKAAGSAKLQQECDKHPVTHGVRCPTGEARITDSCDLKKYGSIQYIIHAVGPDGRILKDQKLQFELLKKTYTSSLLLAEHHKLSSIAFPFISSGIYAIDKDLAAKAAISAAFEFKSVSLQEIRFVLFSQNDHDLFKKLVHETTQPGFVPYGPPDTPQQTDTGKTSSQKRVLEQSSWITPRTIILVLCVASVGMYMLSTRTENTPKKQKNIRDLF